MEFATLVAADLPPSLARDALRVTRAVFGLLEKELDRGDGQGHRDAAASLAGLVARAQIPRTAAALMQSGGDKADRRNGIRRDHDRRKDLRT